MMSSLPVGDGGSQIIMATRGVALGSFDMFHVGHLRALRRAFELSDHLTVAVADDALVEARCGAAPLVPLVHRLEVLGGFGLAQEVVVVDSDLAAGLIEAHAVDHAFVTEVGPVVDEVVGGTPRLPLTLIEVATTTSGSLRNAPDQGLLWTPSGALDSVVCT